MTGGLLVCGLVPHVHQERPDGALIPRTSDEVSRIGFLEGNSNQGDALCYEPVGTAPAYCG